MNLATVQFLNQLNHLFYQTVASSFDATRAAPWGGWVDLLPYLKPGLRVLDLGCGNGRFGLFLQERGLLHTYTGVDSSAFLLARAADALHGEGITLHTADLLSYIPQTEYDLVVLFGVLHHIPGFAQRRALLERAAGALAVGGVLALAVWAFYEQERFRQRIIPWDSLPEYPQLALEPHDYLLDWRSGAPALRYCHYVDRAEMAQLLAGWHTLAIYDADAGNRYAVVTC